jgi:hypothetical protein
MHLMHLVEAVCEKTECVQCILKPAQRCQTYYRTCVTEQNMLPSHTTMMSLIIRKTTASKESVRFVLAQREAA